MKIIVLENGPIYISDGDEKIALCRCGKSQTKPFCDGHHAAEGFKAKGENIWPVSTSIKKP